MAQVFVTLVFGNVLSLHEDSAVERLENEVDINLVGLVARTCDLQRHSPRNHGLARRRGIVEHLDEALRHKLRQGIGDRLPIKSALSDEIVERPGSPLRNDGRSPREAP